MNDETLIEKVVQYGGKLKAGVVVSISRSLLQWSRYVKMGVWVVVGLNLSMSAFAEKDDILMPPFYAEGNVSLTLGTNQSDSQFFFSYSNGLWEVQINPKNSNVCMINCKRIPDGIRYVAVSSNQMDLMLNKNLFTQATAKPIPFPPPDMDELFGCWLSLCPQPELPVINSTQTRRFIPANQFSDPLNIGTYSLEYIEPQHLFLSMLTITNDGTIYSQTERIKLDAPYDHGYEELRYKVVETTNINNFLFPKEAFLYKFGPKFITKDRSYLHARVVAHYTLEKIDFELSSNKLLKLKNLYAADHRPTNLPDGETYPYLVKNDQWYSCTNPIIVHMADMTRQHGKRKLLSPKEHNTKKTMILVLLGTTFLIPPIFIFLISSKKT